MKIQEGPAFGALIIGAGLAYMIWRASGNGLLAVLAGLSIAALDYFVLLWMQKFTQKK